MMGRVRGYRPLLLTLTVVAHSLGAAAATAAALPAAAQSDLRRGVATVGSNTSEEPAVRLESRTREPSAAFMLGSALGAWNSATAQLDYDLKTPSGDGDDSEAIGIDCFDEKTAFGRLESRARSLGLTPQQVVDEAGLGATRLVAAWRLRQAGASPRCH